MAGEGRLIPAQPRARLAALAAAAVLLVVAVAVAVSRSGDSGRTAQPAGTTLPVATAPSTTVAAPTPPTRLAPTTTTVRPTTTAAGARATTTTAPRATTTGAPTTSTTAGALPACTAAFFRSSVTSDRAAYRNGETVQVSARFENVSGRPCAYASTNATSQVLKPDGTPFTPARTLESTNDEHVPFEPGASQTFGSSWEIAVCATEGTCAPGRYSMVVDVAPFGGGRVSFDVTAP